MDESAQLLRASSTGINEPKACQESMPQTITLSPQLWWGPTMWLVYRNVNSRSFLRRMIVNMDIGIRCLLRRSICNKVRDTSVLDNFLMLCCFMVVVNVSKVACRISVNQETLASVISGR
ncbi:hypothetical protein NPIL_47171 [Nephila pilipes]|uniref:Uncharacterized protein n=1 Tax=Nephila pilipes TaxID=299642 RepID=A0A8X6UAU9_NEPPI|nr:hypothetical protein NPIL_47171 [Nephila pilipes]